MIQLKYCCIGIKQQSLTHSVAKIMHECMSFSGDPSCGKSQLFCLRVNLSIFPFYYDYVKDINLVLFTKICHITIKLAYQLVQQPVTGIRGHIYNSIAGRISVQYTIHVYCNTTINISIVFEKCSVSNGIRSQDLSHCKPQFYQLS